MPTREQISDFRSAVLAAFDGVTCPPESDIAPHECEKCQTVRAAFAGSDWRAVPAPLIEKYYSVLPLFSPEAYPYFLGAWLLYALDHFGKHVSPIEFLVYDLVPTVPDPDDLDLVEWERQRLRHLTWEQVEVSAQFLDAVEADPELAGYFGDLGPGRAYYRESWERRWDS